MTNEDITEINFDCEMTFTFPFHIIVSILISIFKGNFVTQMILDK